MKYTHAIIASIICLASYSQDFSRHQFDYEALSEDSVECSDDTFSTLDQVLLMIDQLNSKGAAEEAKKVYKTNNSCAAVDEIYSWALFRSGEWEESMKIIDKSIKKYGSNPNLILRRGYMNIEMGQLGVSTRNIDGNAVYLPESKSLPYDDELFKKQCLSAALGDFKYLADIYQERHQEIFIVGFLYQQLDDMHNSNLYLAKLLDVPTYQDDASLMLVENFISTGSTEEAETFLLELEAGSPRNPAIHKAFVKLYQSVENEKKAKERAKMAAFYSWVPAYTDMVYSEDNYSTILFFLDDNPSKDKLKQLKEISNGDGKDKGDIMITVLNAHANHGNGVETEAEKLLADMGGDVVPKVIYLLNSAPSTCTVSKAASILSEIKDQRGWDALLAYLPRLENIPFTLTPPQVTQYIIAFDKKEALRPLLTWMKSYLETERPKSEDPFADLGSSFSESAIFSPLSDYSEKEVRTMATELGYSESLADKLIEKIY